MKKVFLLLIVSIFLNTMSVYALNDIDDSPVKDEILELESLGIIHGYDDGNFYPDKMITRAEFIALVATIAGLKDPQPSLSSYADIPQEHWANPYINYCDDKGWLREDEDNVYFVDVDENGNEIARTPLEYIEEFARYYRLTRNPDNITQLFEPDKNISYEDAVKLVVDILGYDMYAEFAGYGSSSDAYHITSPRPDGSGGALAISRALDDAGIKPEMVQYYNAHGTSTPINDPAETRMVKSAFGEHAYKMKVSSTKSMTGHCVGAAGAIEAILGVKAMEDSFYPPTINLEEPDVEHGCDLDYVPNKGVPGEINCFASASLGCGGHNGCIVMKKYL